MTQELKEYIRSIGINPDDVPESAARAWSEKIATQSNMHDASARFELILAMRDVAEPYMEGELLC